MSVLLLFVVAIFLMMIGTLGTIIPALPGLPILFAGLFLVGYTSNYMILSGFILSVLGVLTLVGVAVDFAAGALGARYAGASKAAVKASFVGAIVGMFFGVPGIIFGAPLGAAAGELWARRGLFSAGKTGLATLVGFVVGVATKIGIALAMWLIFLTYLIIYLIT